MKGLTRDPVKTVLTITVGLLVVYLFTKSQPVLIASLAIGLAGILSASLTNTIDFLWYKLTWLLSFVVPNVLLMLIYFGVLFPVSLLSKLFRKGDPLLLKNKPGSVFRTCHKIFTKDTFEKPW